MIKILSLFITIFFVQKLSGQSFEGKITYKIICKSNLKNNSDEEMCGGVPTSQQYFIKKGQYKFVPSKNPLFEWILYNNKENRIYSKDPFSDTIYWKAGTEKGDSIIQVKVNKHATTILGYVCDEIVFICKNEIHKLYYSTNFPVNPLLFVNHKYGHLSDFYKRSHAVVLKEILQSKYTILESTAIEIKPMKIEDNFFSLPQSPLLSQRTD